MDELFDALTTTSRDDLEKIRKEIENDVPEPLHSMLEKENGSDAIKKYKERKTKKNIICPPTCTGIKNTILFTSFMNKKLYQE